MSLSIFFRTALGFFVTLCLGFVVLVMLVVVRQQRVWEVGLRFWAETILKVIGVRVHLINPENRIEPAVYVMNHQSIVDIFSIPIAAPVKSSFVAKKELRRFPFIGLAMRLAGCIFVDRKRSTKAIQSIQDGIDQLPVGYSVLIFPEGTRSGSAVMGPFKKGAVHIAIQTKLPIVPLGQVGGDSVALGRSLWCKAGDVFIAVGKPIDTTGWDPERAEQYTEEMRQAVASCQLVAAEYRSRLTA